MSLWPSLAILGFNLVYFSLIGLVLCYAGHPALRVLRDRRLLYLGTISYGLYIYHPLVFLCVARFCGWLGLGGNLGIELVKLIASVALAALSWHHVELPILALRDRFQYGPALRRKTDAQPKRHRPPEPGAGRRFGRTVNLDRNDGPVYKRTVETFPALSEASARLEEGGAVSAETVVLNS